MYILALQLLSALTIIGLVAGLIRFRKDAKARLILILTALLITLLWWQVAHMQTALNAHGHNYRLIVAADTSSQEKGLGGRASLPTDQGMLFVFQGEAMRCLWMKGMQFPLDMIWINTSKQVVHIETNISPATYPATYCPAQPAAYVLELNAGQVLRAGIKLGDKLSF